jgi:hypothetical protein
LDNFCWLNPFMGNIDQVDSAVTDTARLTQATKIHLKEIMGFKGQERKKERKKESEATEQWCQRLYFIRLGQITQEGEMRKAGEQFEKHCLFKFPNHIPKLHKEERRRMSNVLSHCKAGTWTNNSRNRNEKGWRTI